MPINGPTLQGPLAIFNGLTAYGSSAEGGTRAAYEQVERDMGGDFNFRRAFSGMNPEPGDGLTLWSTKEDSQAAMRDAGVAFTAYGRPALWTYYHEMTGWADKPKNTVREFPDPGVWRDRNAEWDEHMPAVASHGAIGMGQDARDGRFREFLGPKAPPWCKWLGFDAYSVDTTKRTPAQLFGPCAQMAEDYGLPWGLAEFSVAGTVAQRHDWTQRAIEYLCNNRHVIFVCWYNSSNGDRAPVVYTGKRSWRLDMAKDGPDTRLPKLWVDLAQLTRDQAADGLPVAL